MARLHSSQSSEKSYSSVEGGDGGQKDEGDMMGEWQPETRGCDKLVRVQMQHGCSDFSLRAPGSRISARHPKALKGFSNTHSISCIFLFKVWYFFSNSSFSAVVLSAESFDSLISPIRPRVVPACSLARLLQTSQHIFNEAFSARSRAHSAARGSASVSDLALGRV